MLILQWAADRETQETGTHTCLQPHQVLLELESRREAAGSHQPWKEKSSRFGALRRLPSALSHALSRVSLTHTVCRALSQTHKGMRQWTFLKGLSDRF